MRWQWEMQIIKIEYLLYYENIHWNTGEFIVKTVQLTPNTHGVYELHKYTEIHLKNVYTVETVFTQRKKPAIWGLSFSAVGGK